MLKNNSLSEGLVWGLFVPLVGYIVLTAMMQGLESTRDEIGGQLFSEGFRRRTFAIVAIGLNSIPMNIAFKRRQTDTMRGIVLPTFVYVAAWLYVFGSYIFA